MYTNVGASSYNVRVFDGGSNENRPVTIQLNILNYVLCTQVIGCDNIIIRIFSIFQLGIRNWPSQFNGICNGIKTHNEPLNGIIGKNA